MRTSSKIQPSEFLILSFSANSKTNFFWVQSYCIPSELFKFENLWQLSFSNLKKNYKNLPFASEVCLQLAPSFPVARSDKSIRDWNFTAFRERIWTQSKHVDVSGNFMHRRVPREYL